MEKICGHSLDELREIMGEPNSSPERINEKLEILNEIVHLHPLPVEYADVIKEALNNPVFLIRETAFRAYTHFENLPIDTKLAIFRQVDIQVKSWLLRNEIDNSTYDSELFLEGLKYIGREDATYNVNAVEGYLRFASTLEELEHIIIDNYDPIERCGYVTLQPRGQSEVIIFRTTFEIILNRIIDILSVPEDVAKRWIVTGNPYLTSIANRTLKLKVDSIPPIRMLEPPQNVYKKCRGDVIVEAEIPPDAFVYGHPDDKCRTNKAIITDMFMGKESILSSTSRSQRIRNKMLKEKVAISCYDSSTQYHIGDKVEIEDFCLSPRRCAAGFHFFCTREQAESYIP